MSLALPTQASKIKGMAVPSSLRIEKPAMCRSGLSPMPPISPGLVPMAPIPIMGRPIVMPAAPHHRLAGHSRRRGRAHVNPFELDGQRILGPPEHTVDGWGRRSHVPE